MNDIVRTAGNAPHEPEMREAAAEIERLRAALQLIAADVTGNKFHQAQFRQDTACEALEAKEHG